MSIQITKLGMNEKHKDIALELEGIVAEGKKLGAVEGAKRIELICDQYKHLSPNAAYVWLNPDGIQSEIEDEQMRTRRFEGVQIARNCFSLAPLIMTWAALWHAMDTYSSYIKDPQSDHQLSFLALWLTGFHGRTPLTFTVAAASDVVLLAIYLGLIIWGNILEIYAHKKALDYSKKLQPVVDRLMKCIMEEGLTLISDQADIDRAVDGVKGVVDSTTVALTKIVDQAVQSMNKVIADNFTLFKEYTADNEKIIKLYIDGIFATQKTTLDSIESTLKNAEQSMKTFVDTATQGQKQTLDSIESSVKTFITDTQSNIKQVIDTTSDTVKDTNSRVEILLTQTIEPMMTDFHLDMQGLHVELASYQTRLNDLTDASQQLAGASQGLMHASKALVDNAEAYETIGESIATQLGALDLTQRDVLSEIQQVAGGITTVASSLNLATANMVGATESIEKIATQIDAGVTSTIRTMTTNVDKATTTLDNTVKTMRDSTANTTDVLEQAISHLGKAASGTTNVLEQVVSQLGKTSDQLDSVSDNLANIELRWFFRRRHVKVQRKVSQAGV